MIASSKIALLLAALSTQACAPLQIGLAAASLLTGGDGSVPAVEGSPRSDLMQSLAGLDNRVSPACQAKIDVKETQLSETSQNAPTATGERCGIQPVCLPGSSTPVIMMVCAEGEPAKEIVAGPAPVSGAPQSPTTAAWLWQSAEPAELDTSSPQSLVDPD
jgi:hypothetical protein